MRLKKWNSRKFLKKEIKWVKKWGNFTGGLMKNGKIAGKIKRQISLFCTHLSYGLPRPKRKFIHQMIYGIQASKDIKLSSITRALGEDIPYIKTENRLSRQISSQDLTQFIGDKLSEEGSKLISEDTVLALDLSDIAKEYSKKQENLSLVRDGSTGEIKDGWYLIGVIGADPRGEKVIPLYGELYSQEADDFESENTMILKTIDRVRNKVADRGIWTLDRGADRKKIYERLLSKKLKFVIRLAGKRDLKEEESGRKVRSLTMAKKCPCRYRAKVTIRGEVFKEKELHIGWKRVKFTFNDTPLALVVVKGYGELPLMLITNLEVKDEVDSLHILEVYLTRWKCEESWRFIKQSYNMEDVRLLKYIGLRNTVILVMAIFFFISVVLKAGMKLRILLKKVYEKAKRFFEIPPFKQYAICDGIHSILFGKKLEPPGKPDSQNAQLVLPLDIFSD